jgi:hypothetical protein
MVSFTSILPPLRQISAFACACSPMNSPSDDRHRRADDGCERLSIHPFEIPQPSFWASLCDHLTDGSDPNVTFNLQLFPMNQVTNASMDENRSDAEVQPFCAAIDWTWTRCLDSLRSHSSMAMNRPFSTILGILQHRVQVVTPVDFDSKTWVIILEM